LSDHNMNNCWVAFGNILYRMSNSCTEINRDKRYPQLDFNFMDYLRYLEINNELFPSFKMFVEAWKDKVHSGIDAFGVEEEMFQYFQITHFRRKKFEKIKSNININQ
jgi:hypothetical protein